MTRIFLVIGLLALFLSLTPILAADYIFDTVGSEIIFDGTLLKSGKTLHYTQKIQVLDPQIMQSDGFDIIHHTHLLSDYFTEEKVLFYKVEKDGIYLVATADQLGGELSVYEEPSLELPLPPEKGKKWQRTRIEGGNLTELNLEITDVDKEITIGDKTEKTVVVKVSGTTVHQGKSSKTEKEIFFSKVGRVKQITKQYISDSEVAVSTFTLKNIIEPGEKSEKNQEPKAEEAAVKDSESTKTDNTKNP
ncbi:hypothetical protein JW979_00640 [bacterium]|nr:hypothetical protein [candidate division CSSED10-310 bacterium]